MTNSEKLLSAIDSTYVHATDGLATRPSSYYAELCSAHLDIIESLQNVLVPVTERLLEFGERVFAVQDLSVIGKGIFIGDYYYNEHGFVANVTDDDAYGYITHWVSFKTIDKNEIEHTDIL